MFVERIEAAREAERAGRWEEVLERYEEALHLLPGQGTAEDAARVLRWIGTVHRERGELELAEEIYEASLTVAELCESTADAASVWNCLAIMAQYRGKGDEAEELYARARELAEKAGNLGLMAMVDQNVGTLASIRGNEAQALSSYRGALQRYCSLGDELSAASALTNIGRVYVRIGDADCAEKRFAEAVDKAERHGHAGLICHVDLSRAEMHMGKQQYSEAREYCDRAFFGMTRMGSKSGMAEAYKLYGMLYRDIGRSHLAEVNLSQALSLARMTEDRLLEAETYAEWASLHTEMGRSREAVVAINNAHRIFQELRASRDVLQVERMFEELQPRFLQAVNMYGEEMAGAADPEIGGHARRVANLATALGEAVGVVAEETSVLRTGALLHDVGKVIVPRAVLAKPGKLTDDEWELVKSHTVAGENLISDLDFAWDIAPIARHHHEHWNGGGYPDKLCGDDIPLFARVVCVADVYDALTTDRAHRPGMEPADAIQEMQAMAGSVLDPDLFDVFRRLAADGVVEQVAQSANLLVAA